MTRLSIVFVLIVQLAIVSVGEKSIRAAPPPPAQTAAARTADAPRACRRQSAAAPSTPLRGSAVVCGERRAATRRFGSLDDAALLRWLAAQPIGIWFNGKSGDPARLRRVLDAADASRTVPVVVAYDIPQRDCGGYSANDPVSPAAYQAWVRSLAQSIGRRPIVVIVEPDAIAHALSGCQAQSDVTVRFSLLRYAVQTLKRNPNAAVYLDAGNAGWIEPVDKLVGPLRAAGIDFADGFSLNVSSFYDTAMSLAYGTALSGRLGGAHFVIDTGRNGNGAAPPQADGSPNWCNPPGRAVGRTPTARTGRALVDAYLWVKPPGNSDGACRAGDPPAGQWWTITRSSSCRGVARPVELTARGCGGPGAEPVPRRSLDGRESAPGATRGVGRQGCACERASILFASNRPSPTCTQRATDGVPSASRAKSMYQPRGRRPGLVGMVVAKPPGTRVNFSSIERCSTSVTWVAALGRISRTPAICSASSLVNTAGSPYVTFGRAARDRRARSSVAGTAASRSRSAARTYRGRCPACCR